ncbi:hypothetical protein NQ314_017101 [Rhamnusium bicolor]|uniref:Uncharacterized protein n=1 Tax=Rhamnusium bicolor TaxID=1586634 RepID=A0AAV8WV73_9CUCU|nr:hypothetical protein NQ314_017101 [Rhamnusium bicolor]
MIKASFMTTTDVKHASISSLSTVTIQSEGEASTSSMAGPIAVDSDSVDIHSDTHSSASNIQGTWPISYQKNKPTKAVLRVRQPTITEAIKDVSSFSGKISKNNK